MSKRVYYDFYEGKLIPIWFVIKADKINWESMTYTVRITPTFKVFEIEDFQHDLIGFSIFLSDLVRKPDKYDEFAIYLPYLKQRAEEFNINPHKIEQFLIRTSDIEELLQMTVIRDRFQTYKR